MKSSNKVEQATVVDESNQTRNRIQTTRKISYYELYRYAEPIDKFWMIIGVIGAAGAGAGMPLTTKIFGRVVNDFVLFQFKLMSSNALYDKIVENTLYFLGLFGLVFICTYIYTATFTWSGERQAKRIREEYLKAVLRMDKQWFDFRGPGEIATRITADTFLVQDGISEKFSFFVMNICTCISAYVIAFTVSWKMTLVMLCVMPVLILVVGVTNRIGAIFTQKALDFYSNAGNIAEEVFSSIRTVVSFGKEKTMHKKYESELLLAEKAGIKKGIAAGSGVGLIYFVMFCAYSLGFWYGGTLIVNGEMLAGDVLNVFFAVLIGSFSLGHCAPDIAAFGFAIGAGSAIFETIDTPSTINPFDDKGLKPSQPTKGQIILKNVDFHYPSRPDVQILKDFNLEIGEGKTVALVGASGSGKSTIIQLVERFYNPANGEILLDGTPIKDYNLQWLRNQIGLVSQEPTLFDTTIYQNIANGLCGTIYEHVPEDEKRKMVEEAAKLANAHDFITKLPKGYDTQVGDRGLMVSGGQKQRIAIARAIVKKAKILLLDEATSALDTESEKIVQAALDKASTGRTTIVVAHRLSTIKDADLIVVMQKGVIVEQGKHDELMSKENGYYRNLVQVQKIAQKKEEEKKNLEDGADGMTPADNVVKQIELAREESKTSLPGTKDIESLAQLVLPARRIMYQVYQLNMPELGYIIIGTISAVVSGAMFPLFAIIFSSMIQVFSDPDKNKVRSGTIFWALMFIAIAFGALISNTLQGTMFGVSGEKLTTRIRSMLFGAFLYQEVGFFDDENHSSGTLTSKLSTEANLVQGMTGVALGTILNVLTNVVGGVLVALIFGWELTLVIFATLPVLIGASMIRMKMMSGNNLETKKAYEHSAKIASEAVGAIRTVSSLTMEKDVLERYYKNLEEPLKKGHKNAFIGTIFYAFSQSMNFLVNALAFWYGGKLIIRGDYDLQKLFTVFMGIIFSAMAAGRVFASAPDIGKAREAAREIFSFLKRNSMIDSRKTTGSTINTNDLKGHVKFENVHFHYPTRPGVKILKGIDFEVLPGQTAALVGQSGCGKSTTIQLMERFYDPIKGKVTVDGKDIKELNLSQYRASIALVGQEPQLYSGTIKENILFGYPQDNPSLPLPSQELIEKAAKEANIHDFILTLPQGYDTDLGTKGAQLSGGQKQRIAIARALIRNPKVLLLDEATSALDGESEKIVQAALDQARLGRTTLTIAHRLSTIQNADVIFVFKNGLIIERGTHQQLLSQKGAYWEMVQAQNLEKN